MRAFLLAITFVLAAGPASAICNARFINPITEVCWGCIFPISIGPVRLFNTRPDTSNPGSPVCLCFEGLLPRLGLSVGIWEPARLVDVANEAGCFVNMGFDIDFGLLDAGGTTATSQNGGETGNSYQVHYYYFPLISWLGSVVDGLCVQESGFDVAYVSEFDPLWHDDELNMLLNPEAVLFANPVAEMACSYDCVRASSGNLPVDNLFWCNGCAGGIYPISGAVKSSYGGIMASKAAASKTVARMHRLLLARKTAGTSNSELCQPSIAPIMPRQQYRFQVSRPRAKTSGRYAGGPTGFSTQYIDRLREYPYKGESFGWVVFRKRNCCAGAMLPF